jgi:hydrogenase maturation factor
MHIGKLPPELLAELLGRIRVADPRVALGATVGEDAALIDMGDKHLVAKTDPITFATDLIGWYMVQVNANDIAVMGGTPKWLLATLLFPPTETPETVRRVFDQIAEACGALDVTLVGGHTEVTYDLSRPIAVGVMLGEVAKGDAVLSSGARPGDSIIVTKGIAVEGTALLAREAASRLHKAGLSMSTIERAQQLLHEPGISVVKDADVLRKAVKVHAMHDATEGGLATALAEVAQAAGVGVTIEAEKVPVLPACRSVCAALGLDPLGLIASGTLVAAVAPKDAPQAIEALAAEGIAAYEIGRFTPLEEGLTMLVQGKPRPLPRFERDEVARFLG